MTFCAGSPLAFFAVGNLVQSSSAPIECVAGMKRWPTREGSIDLEQRPFQVCCFRNRHDFRVVDRLRRDRPEGHAPPGVCGCVLQHLEEQRFGEMKAAARGKQKAAWGEEAERAQVDVLVPADGGGE